MSRPLVLLPPLGSLVRGLQSGAARKVTAAKKVYDDASVAGSPHKDVLGALQVKAAGAFVDSSLESIREGQVLVGAPVEKRLSLSFVSLQACKHAYITQELAASLGGLWISVLMYRRPLMACLLHFFSLGLSDLDSPDGASLLPFSRKEAQAIALLSAIAPLIASNVAVPFSPEVFCSDASSAKGAYCAACVDPPTCAALWLSADRKGAYTKH